MNSTPFLSVCLITKNEVYMLADCIASVRPLAEAFPVEFIVVDTGSTDGTQPLAESLGCHVIQSTWQNDFAQARNVCLEFAQAPWILSIDADERLENASTCADILRTAPQEVGGILVHLRSHSARTNGGSDVFTAQATRIFRRDDRIRWQGIIHEQITDAIQQAGLLIQPSTIVFTHLGYNLSPTAMREKQERNLAMLNTTLQTTPDNRYALFQRAKTLLALGRHTEALDDFHMALDNILRAMHLPATDHMHHISTPKLAEHLVIEALNFYALALYQTKQLDLSLRIARESLRRKPRQTLASLIAGDVLLAESDFRSALSIFEDLHRTLAEPTSGFESEYHVVPEQVYFKMGQCYTGLQEWHRALLCFHEGRKHAPNDIACIVGEANIALRLQRPADAVALLKQAIHLQPQRTDLPQFLAQAEQALQAFTTQGSAQDHDNSSRTILLSGAIIVGSLTESNTPYLLRALSSLASCCDEIIISHNAVNRTSHDDAQLLNVVRTLREQGHHEQSGHIPPIQIVHTIWRNDYSQARNHALQHCSGSWVLMLDSDEWFNTEIGTHIRSLISNAPTDIGGYISSIRHTPTSKESDAHAQTEILRLFRRHPAIQYEGIIHEQVTASITRLGLKILFDPSIVFYHYSTLPTGEKFRRYTALLEAELMRQGATNDEGAFQYVLHILTFGENLSNDEMLNALSKLLTHPKATPQKCAVVLNIYARHLLAQTDYTRLLHVARQSLAYFPNQREALWYDVLASYMLGHYAAAGERLVLLMNYMQALDAHRPTIWHERIPQAQHIVQTLVRLLPAQSATQELATFRTHLHTFASAFSIRLTPQSSISEHAQPPLISLSMIVKNEEHFLPGCLESVRGIVDEIIITDTGSTDRTLTIAQEFGAKIYHRAWTNDFASARNNSLEHCTGKWILYLDADERLIPEQGAGLRTIVEEADEKIGAFLCMIKSKHRQNDMDTEHHVGAYPRLFRNYGYPKVKFIGRVHEQISTSILEAGGGIADSDIMIEHLGYDQDMTIMKQKMDRNYRLLLQHVKEEPENAYAWLQLGLTLNFMHVFDQAEQALLFALQIGNLPKHLAANAAASLANLVGNQRKYEESLHFADLSLTFVPEQNYARHLRAYALLYLGRWEEAEQTFRQVLTRLDTTNTVVRTGFDVAIPRTAVEDGIRKARAKNIAA